MAIPYVKKNQDFRSAMLFSIPGTYNAEKQIFF